jgi:hypothetical protein
MYLLTVLGIGNNCRRLIAPCPVVTGWLDGRTLDSAMWPVPVHATTRSAQRRVAASKTSPVANDLAVSPEGARVFATGYSSDRRPGAATTRRWPTARSELAGTSRHSHYRILPGSGPEGIVRVRILRIEPLLRDLAVLHVEDLDRLVVEHHSPALARGAREDDRMLVVC